MYYVFLESQDGKLGYVGREYFSYNQAEERADEYEGITHIVSADNLRNAKRQLKDRLVKKKKDMSILHKNVRRL